MAFESYLLRIKKTHARKGLTNLYVAFDAKEQYKLVCSLRREWTSKTCAFLPALKYLINLYEALDVETFINLHVAPEAEGY